MRIRCALGLFACPASALFSGRAWAQNPFDQALTKFVKKPQFEKHVTLQFPAGAKIDSVDYELSPSVAAKNSRAVWLWVEQILAADDGIGDQARVLGLASGATYKEAVKLSDMLDEAFAGATTINGEIIQWGTLGSTSPLPALVATRSGVKGDRSDQSAPLLATPSGRSRGNNNATELAAVRIRMKSWVTRTLVGLGMCPFTASADVSGVALEELGVSSAPILYEESSAMYLSSLLADFWTAVVAMLEKGEKGCSSIILSAPLWDEEWEAWHEDVFPVLEASVLAAGLGRELGIVCFHPGYETPPESFLRKHRFGHMYSPLKLKRWVGASAEGDVLAQSLVNVFSTTERESETTELQTQTEDELVEGGVGKQDQEAVAEEEEAAAAEAVAQEAAAAAAAATREEILERGLLWAGSYQRRSPHAMINVLWSRQLEAAEGKRDSENLYVRNVKRLLREGPAVLEAAADAERTDLPRVADRSEFLPLLNNAPIEEPSQGDGAAPSQGRTRPRRRRKAVQ